MVNRGLSVLEPVRGLPILGADQKDRTLWGREWESFRAVLSCGAAFDGSNV